MYVLTVKRQPADLARPSLVNYISRYMGVTSATETANSERIIPLDEHVIVILKLLPSRELRLEQVLVGKREEPMSSTWAELDWKELLEKLGIPHQIFTPAASRLRIM